MAGIYDEQIIGAKQQAETARKLREGMSAPQGQMVSGWYVAPSITQYMAEALKGYNAAQNEKKAQGEYDRLSKQKSDETARLLRKLEPQASVTVSPEMANAAYGQGDINSTMASPTPQTSTEYVQPTEQQRMAALLRGAAVNPEAFAPQVKMAEWDMSRQDKQEQMRQAADLKREQMAQSEALRREGWQQQQEMARLAASLRPAPAQKMVVVADQNGSPVYVPQEQALGQTPWNPKTAALAGNRKSAELTAQQALQQAADLYAHPGREAGTGATSFTSMIPATDAKGFAGNLDTFKAKTFLDAVQQMKGLGALTEQEGKRLVDSIGALDPSMKEEEFVANLQKATRNMYDMAKAKGLNVTLPEFAASSQPSNTPTAGGHPEDIAALLGQYGGKR